MINIFSQWLDSNFIPTDSKKFEFQNFNYTIRFSIKNKLRIEKMRSCNHRIFEKNQFTISKLFFSFFFRFLTYFWRRIWWYSWNFEIHFFRICRNKVWIQPKMKIVTIKKDIRDAAWTKLVKNVGGATTIVQLSIVQHTTGLIHWQRVNCIILALDVQSG